METEMYTMTIGGLAKETGTGIETIRYYERRRLIEPVERRPSGYRIYDANSARKLRFIKNAQRLGFTLQEIGELMKLKVSRKSRCGTVKQKAEAKLAEINSKVAALNSMKKVLKELVSHCREELPTDDCPILASMEAGNGKNKKRR
jgi:DNA-binding transcriptional MerR regulator